MGAILCAQDGEPDEEEEEPEESGGDGFVVGVETVAGDMIALPVMHPGDQQWQQEICWKAGNPHSLKVALLDPQQYYGSGHYSLF